MTTALQILVVVTLIGIIAGLAVTRYGRGWFGTRASDFTAALVGIAGAFLGFHIGVVAGLTPVPFADYLVAIVGALVTLWAWRNSLERPASTPAQHIRLRVQTEPEADNLSRHLRTRPMTKSKMTAPIVETAIARIIGSAMGIETPRRGR